MNLKRFGLVTGVFLLISLSFLVGCGGDETSASPTFVSPTLESLTPTATELINAQPPAPTETPTTSPTAEQPPTETAVSATDTPLPPQPPTCGRPAGWVPYTVQPKNTLFSLAKWTNTTVERIQQANCINGTLIYVGQTLYLPFRPVPPAKAVAPPAVAPSASPTVEKPTAPPPGDPRLEVDPGSGPAGTTFTFRIRDFDPSEVITVEIESSDDVVVDSFSVTMDAEGNLDVDWESPSDLAADFYTVRSLRLDGSQGKSGTVVIF